jgi:hypothetical protein
MNRSRVGPADSEFNRRVERVEIDPIDLERGLSIVAADCASNFVRQRAEANALAGLDDRIL